MDAECEEPFFPALTFVTTVLGAAALIQQYAKWGAFLLVFRLSYLITLPTKRAWSPEGVCARQS
jgi:hypothetical protein